MDRMIPDPDKTQLGYVDRMLTEPTQAALISLPTGDGKTLVSLATVKATEVTQVLVIAPLNTLDGWQAHIEHVLPRHPFRQINSSKEGQQAFLDLRDGIDGAYFVTKDYFALSGTSSAPKEKPDGTFTRGRVQKLNWRITVPAVILDESHKANNRDTAAYKVLRQLKAEWKLALSATPAGNKFDRMWETARWLWPELIDRSKQRWIAQWCETAYNPHNYSHIEVVGERNPGAFVRSLPCYITSDGAFKLPTRVISVRTPLTEQQRKQYEMMKRDSLIWIDENPLVADLPMVQKIRLRQIALGEVTFDEDMNVGFAENCASTKIQACQMILERHKGEQVVFYTDSKRFAYVLGKRIGGAVWTGDLTGKARTDLKEDFIAGRVRHLVAVIAAFGTGTDGIHRAANVEVWCNKSFNDVDNQQCEGRLNRRGQEAHEIVRYELTAPDSGDTLDFERLLTNRRRLQQSL